MLDPSSRLPLPAHVGTTVEAHSVRAPCPERQSGAGKVRRSVLRAVHGERGAGACGHKALAPGLGGVVGGEASSSQARLFLARAPHSSSRQGQEQSPAHLCRLEGRVGHVCPCRGHFLFLLVLPNFTQPSPTQRKGLWTLWNVCPPHPGPAGASLLAEARVSTLAVTLWHEGRQTWKVTLWDTETGVLRSCPNKPWSPPKTAPPGVRGLLPHGLSWARG